MYYNARYYDSALGLFLSPDTLIPDPGAVIDYNRFAYVRNNPLRFSDPSGHCGLQATGGPTFTDCQGGGGWAEAIAIAVVVEIAAKITTQAIENGWTVTTPTYLPLDQESFPGNPPQRVQVTGIPLDGQVAEPFVTTPVEVDDGSSGDVLIPPKTPSASELIVRIAPSESPIWQGLDNYRGGIRMSGSGRDRRYYEWDHEHGGEIEVYDRNGNHTGVLDPTTGEQIKPAVNGRDIKRKLR